MWGGGTAAYIVGTCGQGVQLLTEGTFTKGRAAYSGYMKAGSAAYCELMGGGSNCLQWA